MADPNIYELRTYTIKPEHFPAFLTLTAENIHLRTKHSTLLGYWATEVSTTLPLVRYSVVPVNTWLTVCLSVCLSVCLLNRS
jgi:hypothetical protein